MRVFVRDNNVDQALRVLKKKLQREGVFREMKRRKAYEKPSERKTREKAEAVRRARKAARKQAQREGLIPMPKRRTTHRVGRRCPGCSEFAANISRNARPLSPNAQSIPGMAAGITERLWEIGDIVDVLEAWQRVRVGHVV